jgi:hypothetical protein
MATAKEYADWLRTNQNQRGTQDYQTVLRAFQEARLEELQAKAAPVAEAPKPESGFMPALRAGATELGGGISALMGKVGLKDEAKAEAEYQAAKKRAAEIFKPTEEGWTGAPVTKFLELLGGSAPYMAAPLAAGLGAAALPLTGTAAAVAGLGAAGLTSAGQFTATNLSRQMEEGKKLADTDLGAAALAAIPQAALDTLAMRMIPGIGRMFGQAGVKITAENAKQIAEQGLKKTLIDYTAKTGKTAGIEGATEATQQVFERLQAGLNITDEKARAEYFDSFIGGAVLGGTLAPAGRFVERGREQREARGLLEGQAAEEREAQQAAEKAKKAQPDYILGIADQYEALNKQKTDLEAQLVKGSKEAPLSQADADRNALIQKQLAEVKASIKEQRSAYLAAGGPDAVEKVRAQYLQLEQPPGRVTEPPAAEPVPEAPEEARPRYEQEVRGLTDLLTQQRTAMSQAESVEDTMQAAEQVRRTKTALDAAQDELAKLPQMPQFEVVQAQVQKLETQLAQAKTDGDQDAVLKLGPQLLEARQQLQQAQPTVEADMFAAETPKLFTPEAVAQSAQLQMEEQQRRDSLGEEMSAGLRGQAPKVSELLARAPEEARRAQVAEQMQTEGRVEREALTETARDLASSMRARELEVLRNAPQLTLFPEARETVTRTTTEENRVAGLRNELAQQTKVLDRLMARPPAPEGLPTQAVEGPYSILEMPKMQQAQIAAVERRIEDLKGQIAKAPTTRPGSTARVEATPELAAPEVEVRRPPLIQRINTMAEQALASPRVDEQTKALVMQVQDRLPQLQALVSERPQAALAEKAASPLVSENMRMRLERKERQAPAGLRTAPQEIAAWLYRTNQGQAAPEATARVQELLQAVETPSAGRVSEAPLIGSTVRRAPPPKPAAPAVETQTEREARDADTRREEQARLERQEAIPATRIEFERPETDNQETRKLMEAVAAAPNTGERAAARKALDEHLLSFVERKDAELADMKRKAAKNVQDLNTQRKAVAELTTRLEGDLTPKRRESAEKQLAEAKRKLAEHERRYTLNTREMKIKRTDVQAQREERNRLLADALRRREEGERLGVAEGTQQRAIGPVTRAEVIPPKVLRTESPESRAGVTATDTRQKLTEARGEKQRDVPINKKEQAEANRIAAELAKKTPEQKAKEQKEEEAVQKEQAKLQAKPAKVTPLRSEKATRLKGEIISESESVEEDFEPEILGGPNEEVFFSRGATPNPSTTASVRTELKKAFPDLGRVQIYDSVDALIAANPQYEGRIPSDARGFVDTAGNKAFLIAENINQGQALSVLLHEVGAHIGLKNMLGTAQYNALVKAVETWAKKNDGSIESRVAKAAQARVEAAKTPANQKDDETLAYAIEEAVNAGVKPMETKSVLGRWLSQVAALMRKALEKFGVAPEKLDAQGLVDMAFGAAKMEMRGQGAAAPTGRGELLFSGAEKPSAFKRWFGDSKVVDENGKPLVVYHGTTEDFSVFDRTKATDGRFGAGFYFGRADKASRFAEKGQAETGLVMPVYLNISNPAPENVWRPIREKVFAGKLTGEEMRDALESQGYDGIIHSVSGRPKEFVAFRPEQIKSATGNRGTYDPTSPNILFSRNLPTAARVANNLIAKEKGVIQNLKDNFLGMGFRAQFVDKLAPVEEAFKKGGIDTTKALQAMYYLRMYDQRMHFTSQAISDGVPEIVEKARKDGTTERLIETKPGANIKQIVDILKGKDVVKAAGSPDAANRLFTLYLAAIRAERVGMDALNFGSKVTEADLKAARAEIEANPTLKNAFDEARDIYNQYNRNLIEFAVQTGALAKSEAQSLLASNDYIPYYRMRDGVAQLIVGKETPIRIGNLKDSPHLKELVGGDEAIFDFLTSSVQNTAMLLDMSMKNLATKNAMFELRDVGLATVTKVPKSGKTPEGAVTFKRDGEDYFASVDTDTLGIDSDLLVKGLAGIPTMFPSFVRVLGIPARFLRRVVVASPVYMARQLFRDSLAASMTSGANLVPVLDSLKQIGQPKALKTRGITGGQVFTGMPEDVTRMLKDMQAGKVSVTSGLAWLEAKSAQADALTREAQYQSYRKQGLSEMEATYMALESMNFSKRGLSPTMHMVSTLIPFFNAQIQGLDVLYKAFTKQMPMDERLAIREKLWTRGMLLAGMSVAYAMAMQDDEAYKNARPEEKYGNWFVKVPGFDEAVRLPVPFELGYVFKALPEALVNTLSNEQGGEEALKAGKHIVKQMVPGLSNYFLPQAVKPALETVLGTSIFTGRSIESSREQMVEPGFRYREGTSALAKEVGELTGFSPVKMEYLIRGYTGGMGIALLQALSAPFGSNGPEAATKRLSDMPVIGTLFQPTDASGIIDATYERMKQVNQVKETYESLIERGRQADAQKYIAENMNEMALASMAGSFRQYMGQIAEFERSVRAAPNMTPEQKREKLDQARQMKIRLAETVRAASDRKTPQASPA